MPITLTDVDFGKTAGDYGKHRAGFPPELIDRLQKNYGIGLKGQRVLDLGTGTGTLTRQFAQRGCVVTGLDISANMIAQAKELDAKAGVTVTYHQGKAEELPFPDSSFDVVIAGQCFHWFDRKKAAPEAARVLAPNGAFVIAHFDWIPLDDNVVAVTEGVIAKHNPKMTEFMGGMGMYPKWMAYVARAGFTSRETFSFDLDAPYTHEAWLGRIRASAWVGATLPPDKVTAFDAEHAAALAEKFPEEVLKVPHRVWALVARRS